MGFFYGRRALEGGCGIRIGKEIGTEVQIVLHSKYS